MTNTTAIKRDNRGQLIKKLLKSKFPGANFRVRLEKYSMGESINIHTDLIKPYVSTAIIWRAEAMLKNGGLPHDSEEYKAYSENRANLENNKKVEADIKSLVGNYESIDYDPSSGEILSGGNTYMFVNKL